MLRYFKEECTSETHVQNLFCQSLLIFFFASSFVQLDCFVYLLVTFMKTPVIFNNPYNMYLSMAFSNVLFKYYWVGWISLHSLVCSVQFEQFVTLIYTLINGRFPYFIFYLIFLKFFPRKKESHTLIQM